MNVMMDTTGASEGSSDRCWFNNRHKDDFGTCWWFGLTAIHGTAAIHLALGMSHMDGTPSAKDICMLLGTSFMAGLCLSKLCAPSAPVASLIREANSGSTMRDEGEGLALI